MKDLSATNHGYRNFLRSGGSTLPNAVPPATNYSTDKYVIVTVTYVFYMVIGFCAGVRDRRTGHWETNHGAVGFPISGFFSNKTNRLVRYSAEPRIGDHLWFETTTDPIKTDVVLGIEALHCIPDELLERAAAIVERSKTDHSLVPVIRQNSI